MGELWLGVAAAFRSAVIRDFGEEAENSKPPKQGFLWIFFLERAAATPLSKGEV